jgi:hypothetical protein
MTEPCREKARLPERADCEHCSYQIQAGQAEPPRVILWVGLTKMCISCKRPVKTYVPDRLRER